VTSLTEEEEEEEEGRRMAAYEADRVVPMEVEMEKAHQRE